MPRTKTVRRSKPGTPEFPGYVVPDPNKQANVRAGDKALRKAYQAQLIPNYVIEGPTVEGPTIEKRRDP